MRGESMKFGWGVRVVSMLLESRNTTIAVRSITLCVDAGCTMKTIYMNGGMMD
jgi:hypothetical protein